MHVINMETILIDDLTSDLFSSLKSGEWPTADHMYVHKIDFLLKWRRFDDIMSYSSDKNTFFSVITL